MEGIAVSNEIIPDPQPDAQPDASAIESHLSDEISTLWSEHIEAQTTHKATGKAIRLLRAQLAEKLYQVKSILSRPGRSGQWRGWLVERGIPRSSADRLAARHAETLSAINGNCPTEATNADQVEELLRSLLPRLRRTLVTPDAVFRFVGSLVAAFNLKIDAQDGAIEITKPGQSVSEPDSPAAAATPEIASVTAAAVGAGSPDAIIDADLF